MKELIKRTLDKYCANCTKGMAFPINLKAWAHYRKQAEEAKAWTRTVTAEWLAGACQMSVEMYHKRVEKNVFQLAAEAYSYGYYRSTAKQGYCWIDPQARDLWATFN